MATGSYYESIDGSFITFAQSLAEAIERVNRGRKEPDDLFAYQKEQFTELVKLEEQFRLELCMRKDGYDVYVAFVNYITSSKEDGGLGNMLEARPFFREQASFQKDIVQAMETLDIETLAEFHFNYRFINWANKQFQWGKTTKLAKLERKIWKLRDRIITQNVPLAISRAKVYWQTNKAKAPSTQNSYGDFIQQANEGLMSAVDKFVPAHPRANFRACAVGRMHGNFNKEGTQPLVHFFPKDSRKLWRANAAIARAKGEIKIDALVVIVNEGLMPTAQTNAAELEQLMSASGMADSIEATDGGTHEAENHSPRVQYAAPDSWQPDVRVVEHGIVESLQKSIHTGLSVLEKKVLRLRGVNL
jgi:DNA-directed RNA polymerase specialized sigma subunit